MTGILTKDEIAELIDQPAARCLAPASYDLRLGAEYCVAGDLGRDDKPRIQDCSIKRGVTILPFSSMIVSSYEKVKLPNNVAANFDLRIRLAVNGLIVQMGTQIEPGYEGHVYALIHNVSSRPIELRYADENSRLFTVEFHRLSKDAPVKKEDQKRKNNKSLKEFLNGEALGKTFDFILKDQADGLRSMNSRIDKVIGELAPWKVAIFTLVSGLVLSIFVPIIAGLILSKFPLADASTKREATEARGLAEVAQSNLSSVKEKITNIEATSAASSAKHAEKVAQLEKQIADLQNSITTLQQSIDRANNLRQNQPSKEASP